MSKASLRGLRIYIKTLLAIAAISTLLLGQHLLYGLPARDLGTYVYDATSAYHGAHIKDGDLPCRHLPGADNVTVVMRTGASEITDKLPAHLNTTFRCYKDYLIFSDYEEVFQGFPVYDALSTIDDEIKQTNGDFAYYNRLQTNGRESLDPSELSGQTAWEIGKSGKKENAGWKLDKWKFLPMVKQTLELRPTSDFYLFLEPDSYVTWSTLLRYLHRVDPTAVVYAGSENKIGPDIFAHGGSAFILSRPAMQLAADIYQKDSESWHAFTARHWAGDCILAKALKDAGVSLDPGWPMFQGRNPFDMDFNEAKGRYRRVWCSPAISYHHVSTWEIKQLWDFEQRWLANDPTGPIHHDDVFRGLVMPEATGERGNWTNLSPNLQPDTQHLTIQECRDRCESRFECLQYSKGPEGCSLSDEVRIGSAAEGVDSGWFKHRVEVWNQEHEGCIVRGYLRPEGLLRDTSG